MLGLISLSVGFSDSTQFRSLYNALVVVWEIFNAPAGLYLLRVQQPNWALFGVLQLFTSFLWANLIALFISKWKAHRHNTAVKRDAPQAARPLP